MYCTHMYTRHTLCIHDKVHKRPHQNNIPQYILGLATFTIFRLRKDTCSILQKLVNAQACHIYCSSFFVKDSTSKSFPFCVSQIWRRLTKSGSRIAFGCCFTINQEIFIKNEFTMYDSPAFRFVTLFHYIISLHHNVHINCRLCTWKYWLSRE